MQGYNVLQEKSKGLFSNCKLNLTSMGKLLYSFQKKKKKLVANKGEDINFVKKVFS